MLTVKDVMNGVLLHADKFDNLSSIVRLMYQNNADAIVVREKGVPKGIITPNEIIRAFASENVDMYKTLAEDVMIALVETISHDTDIDSARSVFTNKRLKLIPVKQEYDIIGY